MFEFSKGEVQNRVCTVEGKLLIQKIGDVFIIAKEAYGEPEAMSFIYDLDIWTAIAVSAAATVVQCSTYDYLIYSPKGDLFQYEDSYPYNYVVWLLKAQK